MSVWVPREASPSTQVVWEGRCSVVSNHKSTSVAGGYLLAETLFLDQGWGYHFLTFSALWADWQPSGCAHRTRKALPPELPCRVDLGSREGIQPSWGLAEM